jgi:asparagine synthase (glutamine-hydrolysing)
MIETCLHLYQPARYSCLGKEWFSNFEDVLHDDPQTFNIDVSSVLSILSFNYPCGDRTLFQEIKRQPWLSSISEDGEVHLEAIPPHGFVWDSSENIAHRLFALLLDEAEKACCGKKEIYVLLSGGLDSRIVAGVVSYLYKQRKIPRPVGVTWGIEKSRDVQYAKIVTSQLDFDWQYIPLGPQNILENIHEGFQRIAGQVSPADLHAMSWFKTVSKEALVLAGSYGDSIGRAEFSKKHLLELDYLRPSNPFGIVKNDIANQACREILNDCTVLRQRTGENIPRYVACEHQMQGIYMRNMIGHVMGIINQYCTLYQMFTAPEVYGYMWSLHPARRDDTIYAALLENYLPGLARLPWSRTNKALSGKTIGVDSKLQKGFHDYPGWCSGTLYAEIKSMVDPDWFDSIGIFNPQAIRFLNQSLSSGSSNLKYLGMKPYSIWLWLAGFRILYDKFIAAGKEIKIDQLPHDLSMVNVLSKRSTSEMRRYIGNNPLLYKTASCVRRWWYKRAAIRAFPPVYNNESHQKSS